MVILLLPCFLTCFVSCLSQLIVVAVSHYNELNQCATLYFPVQFKQQFRRWMPFNAASRCKLAFTGQLIRPCNVWRTPLNPLQYYPYRLPSIQTYEWRKSRTKMYSIMILSNELKTLAGYMASVQACDTQLQARETVTNDDRASVRIYRFTTTGRKTVNCLEGSI